MHDLIIGGSILGLLAIAGGQGLVRFVVRAGLVLFVAWLAIAFNSERGVFIHDRSMQAHYARCEQDPRLPECPWNDYAPGTGVTPAKPAAIPAPPSGTSGTIVPDVPPVPAPQGVQWSVDDLGGPWSEAPMMPPSARADRLLRRLHQAQGLEVGQ